jgi:ammonium transporter Rh
MKNIKWLRVLPLLLVLILSSISVCYAENAGVRDPLAGVADDQKYNRAIHIMAMLLLGFGFLMVFVRKYGRSALTATFLLVSVAIPVYLWIKSYHSVFESKPEIDSFILAEFAAASLLITAGAVLGRLKMLQYIILGILFVPFYVINEWILMENGLGFIPKGGFADTGGSIMIHAFGAIFGLGVAITMTTKQEFVKPIETDTYSDKYSMIGSMVLWIFWPSFCAALVPIEAMPHTVVNVVLALCGSTLATYITSKGLRGKISMGDIANAALAGGVAIGATCDYASHSAAIVIGVLAGGLSTFGFAYIQEKQQKLMKVIDTCGVSNLHGLPGLMGGIAALPIIKGLGMNFQLSGIGITIILAIASGFITGKILPAFGRKTEAYEDSEDFIETLEIKELAETHVN